VYVLELVGEDDGFAAAEAAHAATAVERVAPGLVTAESVRIDRVRGLAYTRAVGEVVARTGSTVEAARAALEEQAIDRNGSVAVSARAVRGTTDIDTRAAERALGDVLTAAGLVVDLETPDHELRALFADGTGILAWLEAESRRDFDERAPTDKPFFHPGSMDPLEARAVANLAGAQPGRLLLDPVCGTGGLLIEAGLVGASVLGLDAQLEMVRGARENFERYLEDWSLCLGDTTRLPVGHGVDAVVADLPYGRQSVVAHGAVATLIAGTLAEARRVASRAVVVVDRNCAGMAREAGWTVSAVHERPVHRSLTRYVHVLTAEEPSG
jgi:tRNA (guanine10-N2)-dimethyltransferase